MQANQGRVVGGPQRLTMDAADDFRPSVSSDGKKLVFGSSRSGNWDVWIRDMDTGKETALTATPWDETHAKITPDGSKVTYGVRETQKVSIYVVAASGGMAEKVCEDCGLPLDWSPDGQKILFYWGEPVRYTAIDPASRQRHDVIHHPKHTIHRALYSPDGKWLAFHIPMEPRRSVVFIAPLHDGVAAAEKDWISVTEGSGSDAHPWWSPDGNLLYFLSERDGFLCVWKQRLDPATKRPVGAASDFYHFHGARRSVNALFGGAMTRDRLFFSMVETTGNIWMTRP